MLHILRSYWAVLRLPGYRWFWTGAALNQLGSQVGAMGLVWFVKELTDSPVAVGLVLSLRQVPLAIGSLLAGPLLDRTSRRGLLILDNLLRGLLFLALPLLYLQGWLTLWQIYLAVTLAGLLSSLTTVGSSAITPALVGRGELLPAANALNQVQWQVAYLIGPALAGLLLLWFQPATILAVDGLTFLLFALALTRLPPHVDQVKKTTATYWRSLADGASWLVNSRPLSALTVHTFLFNMAYGPLAVSLPFYADETLQAGPGGLGWLWSAFAAGSLLGGLAAGAVAQRPAGRSLAVITLLWGLLTGPLLWISSLPVALLLLGLAGAAWAPYNVVAATARQRIVPPEAYGRVFGLTLVLTQLGAPVGSWVGGYLVARFGAAATLGLAAAACLALGASAWFSGSLRGLERQPHPALEVR